MDRGEDLCYKDHQMEVEEDFYSFQLSNTEGEDPEDLLAALRQKEEEVLVAAQLGNALLLENRQLKQERQALRDKYTEQLEELQQGRYELQVKLDSCRVHWENQVAELEQDVQDLQEQVKRLTQSLCEAEKEKNRLNDEHSEQSLRLRDQFWKAMEVEQTMTSKLQRLKDELRERGHPRPQDEEIISALREQVARLVQREQILEQRLKTVCQENEELQQSVSSLHTQLDLQNQHCQKHTQQLAEAWREVEDLHARMQELQSQIYELQEEEKSPNDMSLLSELENSLESAGWNNDKEQDMRSPTLGAASDLCENSSGLQGLKDQNEQLIAENTQLKQHAKKMLNEEVVQQALKDRDDALVKKTAMEAELLKTKQDMMCLNNQLLEAIQRKLELSQELEAWQDDIQVIINQQLKSQQQTEQLPQKRQMGHLFQRKSRRASSSLLAKPVPGPEQNQSHWRDWFKLK